MVSRLAGEKDGGQANGRGLLNKMATIGKNSKFTSELLVEIQNNFTAMFSIMHLIVLKLHKWFRCVEQNDHQS